MVFKFFHNLREGQRGITIIEVAFVIFMIGLFSAILISDFPKVQRQFALSRATYKLAQDIRHTQNLGVSGVQAFDMYGDPISVRGYGIYFNIIVYPALQYIIYADVDGGDRYGGYKPFESNLCSKADATTLQTDCVVQIIDLAEDSGNTGVYIKDFVNITAGYQYVSINFSPPNPIVNIDNICTVSCPNIYKNKAGIVLGLITDESAERTVWVNKSGLISIE